jgi:glutamate racemase
LIEKELLNYFKNVAKKFDVIVLGCTHYAIIEDLVGKTMKTKNIISSSEGIVDDVDKYLTENNMKGTKKGIQIYTTGVVENFVSSSSSFFDYKNIVVKKLF